MKRLVIGLLWLLLIAGVCIALDQILLRMPLQQPVLGTAQTFYRDFRGRLLRLAKQEEGRIATVKASLPAWGPAAGPAPAAPAAGEAAGYVYTDRQGGLHMATRIEEIPEAYRASAKPLQK